MIAFNKHCGYSRDGRRTLELSSAAAAVGIVSGVSNIMGGSSGGGGGGSAGGGSGIADPFQGSRGQYASQLNALMSNPSSILSQPGYQTQQQAGMQQVQRSSQAGGKMGGSENIALQEQGQSTFANYYTNLLNNLAQFSGASWQSGPAAGQLANQQNQAGWGSVAQGLGALNTSLGSSGASNTSSYWGSPGSSGTNSYTQSGTGAVFDWAAF